MKKIVYLSVFMFAVLQTFAQTYTYDNLNRLKKVVYENGTTVTYNYDALGNRLSKKVTGATGIHDFTVTVTASPDEGGTVLGGGSYPNGTVIELIAAPNDGYDFVAWNDGVTDNPRYVTITHNMSFTALFALSSFTTDWAQKVILYMRSNQIYEYGVPELTDIKFDEQQMKLTVNKTNNQKDEYNVLQMDSITFVDEETPVFDEHEWVDLGLPSGTLWATCNVGANSPEEYGDYFAWGEREPKEDYSCNTYKYCKGDWEMLTKYCYQSSCGYNGFTDTLMGLEAKDDAATKNWGAGWQTPSDNQIVELYNNTTQTWTTQGGVNGRLFTASNGNSIFLPAAGNRWNDSRDYTGSRGYYWSRSLFTNGSEDASALYFDSGSIDCYPKSRYSGAPVRPVRK